MGEGDESREAIGEGGIPGARIGVRVHAALRQIRRRTVAAGGQRLWRQPIAPQADAIDLEDLPCTKEKTLQCIVHAWPQAHMHTIKGCDRQEQRHLPAPVKLVLTGR